MTVLRTLYSRYMPQLLQIDRATLDVIFLSPQVVLLIGMMVKNRHFSIHPVLSFENRLELLLNSFSAMKIELNSEASDHQT